ncbi:hypothetical protein EYC84_008743 [Monilinia fructicola]|uniref:DDH domain-containing protein n=1 Tax=Monilinia fructicola TaxID=38448 RepID=A0A5M9JC10_MONFR|nr:hypothetical protein EYC84_008743 [Monilinia fructicola]
MDRGIKRKAAASISEAPKKSVKVDDYCNTPVRQSSEGEEIWPAPRDHLEAAYDFIRECATAQKPTLIVPDKDADGLSAGVIMYRTLLKLGLNERNLDVHLVQKGSNIHEEYERKAMAAKKPSYVIVLDQGSRGGLPVIDDGNAKCMIIDHHLSDDFPRNVTVVSGCHCPPVPTTALMTYEICKKTSFRYRRGMRVHPVIATRWAGFLKSKALEIVMVAQLWLPARKTNLDSTDLVQRLGDSFARGHKEASGGIVNTAEFEELYALMKVGEKAEKLDQDVSKIKVEKSPQKNTLNNYFNKS